MTENLEELWGRLEAETGMRPGTGVVRLRLTKELDDGLYIGLDAGSKRRLFLVAVQDPEKLLRNLPHWREVRIEPLRDPEDPAQSFVRLELVNAAFRDVFSSFAADLYRTLSPLRRGLAVPPALANRLEKWQQFFREHGPSGLDPEAQRGLFGELWFLRHAVLPRLPGVEGVRRWKGPEGSPHDFRFVTGAVEVKVAGGPDPERLRISNENQLDDAGMPSLYLYVLILASVQDGGLSLPALVGEVRLNLHGDPTGSAMFEEKLIQAGYLTAHEPAYLDVYTTSAEAFYRVGEGFPRIIRPASGVARVRYEISLSSCQQFRVDPNAVLPALMEGSSSV